jgi:hypothetical protein
VPVALAIVVTTSDARVQFFQGLAAFTMAATGLLTGSRGGAAAMVFALACSVLVGKIRPLVRGKSWQQASVPGLVVAGALATAVVIGAEPLLASLRFGGYAKFGEIGRAFGLALVHPWVGVGRGGFSVAMSPTMSVDGRFVHAENFVATWASEWGIPVAAALMAVIARALGRLAIDKSALRNGAAIALLAYATQNFLDLGLELIGLATVAAATLGAALGDADGPVAEDAPSVRYHLAHVGRFVGIATAICLALFSAGAFVDGDAAFENRLELHRAAYAPTEFRHELERAIAAHPLEPALFMLAGAEAVDRRDPVALRWLNLAMLRAPKWSAPHAEAARMLLALGHPRQAALEAGQAAKRSPPVGASASCAIARVDPNPDLIMVASAAVPTGERRQAFLASVIACLGEKQARQLDALLLQRNAPTSGTILREYARMVAEGAAPLALKLLKGSTRMAKPDAQVLLQYVRTLVAAGDVRAASEELQRARVVGAPKEAVARIQAEIATVRGDAPGMRAAIDLLRAECGSSPERLADAASLLATLEERLGDSTAAGAALDDAATLHPTPSSIRSVLSFALRAGNLANALRARASLCTLFPAESECRAPLR